MADTVRPKLIAPPRAVYKAAATYPALFLKFSIAVLDPCKAVFVLFI
jgi:hypothetical protein